MAVTVVADVFNAKSADFLRLRIGGARDGVTLPERVVTISLAQLAEGGYSVDATIDRERANAETRLNNLVAAHETLRRINGTS